MKIFYKQTFTLPSVAHTQGAYTPDRAPFYLISLVSIVVAGVYAQRLYFLISRSRSLSFLVYPVFLFAMMWTYTIHMEANYSYPYDMMSVAFFSAGLYYIAAKRFLPLVLVLLVGTVNRETTLFLIIIYVIDAITNLDRISVNSLGLKRYCGLPWVRILVLSSIWVAIKLSLAHIYAHNSTVESYVRIQENIGRLKIRLIPALLNICGYLLPLVLLFHRQLKPIQFKRYLWVVPLWLAIMFYTGVILETRVYGELCPYLAVATVLIMEEQQRLFTNGKQDLSEASA